MDTDNTSNQHKDFSAVKIRKKIHVNKSKAFTSSSVLKRHRTETKAHPIKNITLNKCDSIRNEQLHLSQRLCSLIDDIHMQLDSKLLEDSKDHSLRKKYREHAKVYMHDLYEIAHAEFIIDSSDLDDVVKSILYKLDGHSAEYVIREVINRIFASIGVCDSRLTPRYYLS
jgi:hypothetical protein